MQQSKCKGNTMNFFKYIINFFKGEVTVSDEAFEQMLEENEAIQCPQCGLFLDKQTWIDENYKCIRCKTKFTFEQINMTNM